ncbi:GYF domain-containing protein [Anaeromyxobacter oryzae]|uniref:GYF domain-containing protein n=1 Tax=Anaeromyxobacter oryzae TaxID=2918170 RepID=A0ABM7WRA2_9BACT|nr:GYF domain-containing protein [Anaeromyxobacter oryzae]BDG01991.1 hypothetical protein AMOR_09870 [Anaeromyxobacter oryzae]
MTEQSAQWWYENEGQPAGPISAAMLHGLIQSGQVRPTARVWRAGMAGWEQVANVPELAALVAPEPPPMAPPPMSPPGAGAEAGGFQGAARTADPSAATGPFSAPVENGRAAEPQPAFGPAGGAQPTYPAPQRTAPQQAYPQPRGPLVFEEISVAGAILLSIVTFGIYGLVKFYQTGMGYERLAGRESRFATFFWLVVGLGFGAPFVNFVAAPVGFLLSIGGLVCAVLALFEALSLRDEGLRRYQLSVPVTSDSTHKVLFIVGAVLSPIVLGLILLAVQAVKWFEDWNQIVRGLGPRRF